MIVFDLESYKDVEDTNYISWKSNNIQAPGNYKDPAKIAENIAQQKAELADKFALSPLTGKIILIGMLMDKLPPLYETDKTSYTTYSVGGTTMHYIGLSDNDESVLLSKWWDIFSFHNLNSPTIVSFNGKKFDLPFILHRSIIKKALVPRRIKMSDYLNKYRNDPHFDVYNWFDGGSLVEWSYRLGITDSLVRDGNKIGSWYEAGQMNVIADKNKIDLAQTFSIYQRVRDWL